MDYCAKSGNLRQKQIKYILLHFKIRFVCLKQSQVILTPFSYAGRQSQRLRAGGLEEGGEGCEQSKETLKEESKQSSPRNKHIH